MKLENYKSGEYLKIENYKAFILSKINYDWTWENPKTNKLIDEASRLIGEVNAYYLLMPNFDIHFKNLIQIEANKSCMIDGINVSLENEMLEPIELENENNMLEVKNCVKAIEYGIESAQKGSKICTRLMREMHEILMQNLKTENNKPGKLRNSQNWVGGKSPIDADYVPPPHGEIIECLTDFEEFIDNDLIDTPELVKVSMLHYQFESIHPFMGGNGIIGRMIVPLYLKSKGVLDKPCLFTSDYLEKNKRLYFSMLTKVRTSSDMIGWINFFLEAIKESAKNQLNIFKNLIDFDKEMEELMANMIVKQSSAQKVFKGLYEKPIVYKHKMCELTNMKRGTMRTAINELVDKEIINIKKEENKSKIIIFKKYMNLLLNLNE